MDDFPDIIPIFPLHDVLLLPRGHLPLNIFEPRYMAMIDYAFKHDRLIGMIQSDGDNALFQTGCVGRIMDFCETSDNRYEISLMGLSRFTIARELPLDGHLFRRVHANWSGFANDGEESACLEIDRARLCDFLEEYFKAQSFSCDWDQLAQAGDSELVTALAMVCPFDAQEKQLLLEAANCQSRAELFMMLLEMAVRGEQTQNSASAH